MSQTVTMLAASAASVAFIHTVIGVDHYLPFVALGRAGGWSLRKTLFWTGVCGLGHVLSSIALAAAAGALGWAIGSIESMDAVRADTAAYLLVGCGLAYAIWGLTRRPGHHAHTHDQGPEGDVHDQAEGSKPSSRGRQATLWALFIIFVLGPCEPLIPLLLAPALSHDVGAAIAVVGLFSFVTIGTMLVMVTIGTLGVARLRFSALERWAHPLAGAAIAISGGLILLGL